MSAYYHQPPAHIQGRPSALIRLLRCRLGGRPGYPTVHFGVHLQGGKRYHQLVIQAPSNHSVIIIEAEYIGQTPAAKEAIWLRNLLEQLNPSEDPAKAVIILTDNQGAIALAKNPQFHSHIKHIDINIHFIREQVAKKAVELVYTPIQEQVADGLTKSLPEDRFISFRKAIGVESPP